MKELIEEVKEMYEDDEEISFGDSKLYVVYEFVELFCKDEGVDFGEGCDILINELYGSE